MKPLEGLLVLDFSQFLAGPSAALRLGDLGARVIKIERPGTGELNRQLSIKNQMVDGDSMLFHTINRGKESYAANLKDSEDAASVRALIAQADVLIENFRPGTMEKLGFGYDAVKELNSGIVYATVTGYGQEGPWRDKPGQDLLIQSLSGLAWLNGNADQPPVPFGLAVADMFAGAHLVQGILACLVRRGRTGQGGRVEVSLLESALDLQFEVLTTHLNDGGELPQRSAVNNAHAYLGAPYGIYETKNGYLALAMGSVIRLGELLACEALAAFQDPKSWFTQRDEIKQILVDHIPTRTTEEWLQVLEPADYWCADVLTWERLFAHDGFKSLGMVQDVGREDGDRRLRTTRCPIRINGERLFDNNAAPKVGEHNAAIEREFRLRDAQPSEGQHQPDGGERV
ncbi:CaiB/BaiF CoA-transferase family protein [Paenibacillus sp. BC26]|uniref:CaiB/BaiF CoA transferase family protein n=1 Tax=Paenibacillus sp. BC26 TaxID=1881032 RepID=UPI0008E444FC|nr:CaiB/BaiF CoA-transferase family protein [Paenibacillus sp. BC26]SFS71837.1 Crotonobetainyl-CoA:carnitine CoA-transferase CaiB [Paenibacillus sp. BC26]